MEEITKGHEGGETIPEPKRAKTMGEARDDRSEEIIERIELPRYGVRRKDHDPGPLSMLNRLFNFGGPTMKELRESFYKGEKSAQQIVDELNAKTEAEKEELERYCANAEKRHEKEKSKKPDTEKMDTEEEPDGEIEIVHEAVTTHADVDPDEDDPALAPIGTPAPIPMFPIPSFAIPKRAVIHLRRIDDPTEKGTEAATERVSKDKEAEMHVSETSENSDSETPSSDDTTGKKSKSKKKKKRTKIEGLARAPSKLGPDFRTTVMQKRDQSDKILPESIYCFVNQRMDKSRVQIVAESYINDDLTTAQNDNRQTVPIKDACYVLTQNTDDVGPDGVTAEKDLENCVQLRLSDDLGWLDMTPGGQNPPGKVINHRHYFHKTGPAVKGRKQFDNKMQKHIFTLNDPYKLQVVQYFGDFETKEAYIARMSTTEHAEVVVPDTLASTDAVTVPTSTVDGEGTGPDGTAEGAPPFHPVEMPSEEETDDEHAVNLRRYRQPRITDEDPKEKAYPRYDTLVKLVPAYADDIIEAYSHGNGKLLNPATAVIYNQKPGDVFVFDIEGHGDWWKETILKDTYSWGGQSRRIHYDSRHVNAKYSRLLQSCKVPVEGSKVIKPDKQFQRVIYYDMDDRKIAVIQYLGSTEGIKPVPHGNARGISATPFVPTSAQVKFDINKVGLTKKPNELYNEGRARLPAGQVRNLLTFRNQKQITNSQAKLRRDVNISTNMMENIHAVAHELPEYVRAFHLKPTGTEIMDEFVMILVVEEMAEEVRKVLKEIPAEEALVLGADPTFDLAKRPGCYATPLYLRHPYVERRTLAPHQTNPQANMCIGMMLHDTKQLEYQQTFITQFHKAIDSQLPQDAAYRMAKKNIYFLSDAELKNVKLLFGNTEKPKEGEPERTVTHIPCWNHMKDNVKRKFRDMHVTEKETVKRAMDDFNSLLKSESQEEYDQNKYNMTTEESPWSTPEAQAYFNQHLDERISTAGATFRLREAGFPNPENGITNNASESINATIKRQTNHTKQDIPDLMLHLYFNMRAQAAQIEEAYYDLGEYKVSDDYAYLKRHPDAAPPQVYKTVPEMKSFLREALTADEAALEAALVLTGDEADDEEAVARETTGPPTIDKLAKMIYLQGDINFSRDDQGVLLVRGIDRNKQHKVSVVDRTCDCGKKNCQHLRAVAYQMGLAKDFGTPTKPKRPKPVAKPKFRRAKLPATSGTKKPRKKDLGHSKKKKTNYGRVLSKEEEKRKKKPKQKKLQMTEAPLHHQDLIHQRKQNLTDLWEPIQRMIDMNTAVIFL